MFATAAGGATGTRPDRCARAGAAIKTARQCSSVGIGRCASAMGAHARERQQRFPNGNRRPSGQPAPTGCRGPNRLPSAASRSLIRKRRAPGEVPAKRLVCLRTGLEDPLQAELNPARLARRVDRSCGRPTDGGVRPSEDGCIGEVEGLEPELDVVALPRQGKPAR